ncbi:site-specific integrase [Streptomyces sp. NPDC004788]
MPYASADAHVRSTLHPDHHPAVIATTSGPTSDAARSHLHDLGFRSTSPTTMVLARIDREEPYYTVKADELPHVHEFTAVLKPRSCCSGRVLVAEEDDVVANSVGWHVYRYDLERSSTALPEGLSAYGPDPRSWVERLGGRHGQRFLLGPDGLPDLRVNAFFASPGMRNLSELTNRDYAYSLALWLNFLLVLRRGWWEATEEDAAEFQFWRLTDPGNDRTVRMSSFARDVAGCRKFYRWACRRYQVVDPFDEMKYGRGRRQENVKWLDPAAIRRWRDLGVRGRGLDGRVDRRWRGRNDQRDAAFVDGLYCTGLRLTSWASVVLPELPRIAPGRGYLTCTLADQCAKAGYGYTYWMPRSVATEVHAYCEGARAQAVRRARVSGRYETVRGVRVVRLRGRGKGVEIPDGKGSWSVHAWSELSPQVRQGLFVETRRLTWLRPHDRTILSPSAMP